MGEGERRPRKKERMDPAHHNHIFQQTSNSLLGGHNTLATFGRDRNYTFPSRFPIFGHNGSRYSNTRS